MRITKQRGIHAGTTALLLAALFAGSPQAALAAGAGLLKLDTGLKGSLAQTDADDCDDDGMTVPVAAPKMALAPAPAASATAAAPAKSVAPAPVAVTQKAAEPATQNWELLPSDKTLNAALARWAASAGWQLVWELPIDYAVELRATVPGSFQEAVKVVTRSMDSAEVPAKVIFYEGNKVLRIIAKGAE